MVLLQNTSYEWCIYVCFVSNLEKYITLHKNQYLDFSDSTRLPMKLDGPIENATNWRWRHDESQESKSHGPLYPYMKTEMKEKMMIQQWVENHLQ